MIGGISIIMFNGSFYLWSNICIYVLSYFHYKGNDGISLNDIFRVDLALALINNVGY